MIDLDKGKEQLDKADGFLEKLEVILRKHWGKLILAALGYGIYWFFGLVAADIEENGLEVEPEKTKTEVVEKTLKQKIQDGDVYITKKTFDLDAKGDTFYLDYWSDGVIDKYYPKKQ